MGRVVAGITTSVDGYITGPDDGPGCGLGVGGERLHYWVFGGPWSYDSPQRGEATGDDKAWLDQAMAANGAVIAGRGTYQAAGHWGAPTPGACPSSSSRTVRKSSRRAKTSSSSRALTRRSTEQRRLPARRTSM